MRCECCPANGGPDKSLPDTCAAYNLLQDLGDAANIHEWFRMFCELHEPPGGGGGGGGGRNNSDSARRGGGVGGKKKGGGGKGPAAAGRGKGPTVRDYDAGDDNDEEDSDEESDDDEEEEELGGGKQQQKGSVGGEKAGEKGTLHLAKQRLWELQARFTRAVAELEFLGVARPVKRRKVEYMQRTAFPLDKLLGSDDRVLYFCLSFVMGDARVRWVGAVLVLVSYCCDWN